MTNEQQRSPIFCLDKLKKHLYNTIWGIKPLLMMTAILLRCHCSQCHCNIIPSSHHRLHQWWPPSTMTTIAAAAINCRLRQQWPQLLPLTMNNDRWLLVVVIANCVAAAMLVVDSINSGCCQRWWQWNWVDGANGSVADCSGSWWWWQQWHLYHCLPWQRPPSLPSLPLPLPSHRQGLDGGVEGPPWHISFIIAMVVLIGTIFVSTHKMTGPRMTALATDKAVMPISMAGKKWDTTTPSAWNNKNKTNTKTKTKTKK